MAYANVLLSIPPTSHSPDRFPIAAIARNTPAAGTAAKADPVDRRASIVHPTASTP